MSLHKTRATAPRSIQLVTPRPDTVIRSLAADLSKHGKVRLLTGVADEIDRTRKPTDKQIEEGADVLAFLAYWTGLDPQ